MNELTIEKLVPLLTSTEWDKRLVGEYYELLLRQDRVRNRIERLRARLCTVPSVHLDIINDEIVMMKEQFYVMKNYEAILYSRLARYGIPYVDILSEILGAGDVL